MLLIYTEENSSQSWQKKLQEIKESWPLGLGGGRGVEPLQPPFHMGSCEIESAFILSGGNDQRSSTFAFQQCKCTLMVKYDILESKFMSHFVRITDIFCLSYPG